MILGIGVDLVEVVRLERALRVGGVGLERRLYSEAELASAAGRPDRVEFLATRFAAKEACLKALGTGLGQGISFTHIEITDPQESPPQLCLQGPAAERARKLGVQRLHLSWSRCAPVLAATVLLEG